MVPVEGDMTEALTIWRRLENEDVLVGRPANKAVGIVKNRGPELLEAAL